jgi:5-methylcytosine-specific restriction endonuclease McrA
MKRIDPLHDKWAKKVKIRDGHRCQICGKKSKWNHAHHIDGYDWFAAGRYILSNGVTLCSGMGKYGRRKGCHNEFHDMFGRGGNTREQYERFKRIKGKR